MTTGKQEWLRTAGASPAVKERFTPQPAVIAIPRLVGHTPASSLVAPGDSIMSPHNLNSVQMLDREFLEIRCRLIDIAASLDRVERCPGPERALREPRYAQIREALALLASAATSDRAERVQMIFSDPFAPA